MIKNTYNAEKKIYFFVDFQEQKDFASISGRAGLFAGFGFTIYLFNDSCIVFYDINTDDPEIYKLNKEDSVYKTGLQVPVQRSKVTVSRKPGLVKNSESTPISGLVELTSREFYEKANGSEKNIRWS